MSTDPVSKEWKLFDGSEPDVDPATGDEAETELPHFTLEVHDSRLGAGSDFDND